MEQIVGVHGVVTWWSVVMSLKQIVGVHGVVTWWSVVMSLEQIVGVLLGRYLLVSMALDCLQLV